MLSTFFRLLDRVIAWIIEHFNSLDLGEFKFMEMDGDAWYFLGFWYSGLFRILLVEKKLSEKYQALPFS